MERRSRVHALVVADGAAPVDEALRALDAAGVGRTRVVGPAEGSAAALAALEGRHLLLLAGGAAPDPAALDALLDAVTPFRVGAASAYASGGRLLVADAPGAGSPTPIGGVEPACALFRGDVLARLEGLADEPADGLADRLSFELARRGFWRVAVPGAVVRTREGWRPPRPRDPRVAAKLDALRAVDARRRAFPAPPRDDRLAGRRPRVAIDLSGTPYHGVRMNGTRRMCYAAARAIDARLGERVDLSLVVDDAAEAERVGLRHGRPVVGWAAVPDQHVDATLRPAQFFSAAGVLEVARASRSFSVVVLDLIAYQLEDVNGGLEEEDGGVRYDVEDWLEKRAVVDLSLELCRRALAISRPARDELAMAFAARPDLVAKLGVVPLADLREPAPAPSPVAGLAPGRFFLWVGNGYPHKNLDQALAGWRAARASHPGLPELVLLGARSPDARSLAELSDGEVEWLYRNAAATLYTSLWEGFGLPLLEAAAAGSAVLASRTPTNVDLVGDDHPGLFVTSSDLAALLVRAAADPAPFRAPGCAARFPRAAFEEALVADVEAQLAGPAPRRWLSPDPRALSGPPTAFSSRPAPASPVTAWVARRLAGSPRLWRLGKFVLDELRGTAKDPPP